jgi:hypothetical protein
MAMNLPQAECTNYGNGQGNVVIKWSATAYGVTVTFTTTDPDLTLYASPIYNMRQVGIALVDETGTMRVNNRRDRLGNE